jgi:S1-C subfamily serine protease
VRSSSGTAFSIDSRGLWMTARHVVDACPKAYVLTGPRRGMLVRRTYIHPSADIAFVVTERGAPAFAFAWEALRLGQTGFHFGFPKGRPGDVKSRLIGRRVMRVRGRYRTAEPIVAWVERVRVPDGYQGLGGISGGPAFDARGRVIGVTVAGTVRRGRVYTTALTSMRAALARARIRGGDGQSAGRIPSSGFADFATVLRDRLSIAKIVCLVPRRRRNPRRPAY